MNSPSLSTAGRIFREACGLLRRLVAPGRARAAGAEAGPDSYVGVFQGVIETDSSAAVAVSPPAARPRPMPARASGFVQLEVDRQKKATGCFLFFADGKVLTGAIEGSSEKTGFVEASFRLSSGEGPDAPRPVAAVGRLTLEARGPRQAAGPAEDMTIRFV